MRKEGSRQTSARAGRRAALLAALVTSAPALALNAALAAPAAPAGVPDARRLGTADALIEYCRKADPPAAVRFHRTVDHALQGQTPAALEQLRASPEYHAGHQQMVDFLDQVAEQNALRACSVKFSLAQPAAPVARP